MKRQSPRSNRVRRSGMTLDLHGFTRRYSGPSNRRNLFFGVVSTASGVPSPKGRRFSIRSHCLWNCLMSRTRTMTVAAALRVVVAPEQAVDYFEAIKEPRHPGNHSRQRSKGRSHNAIGFRHPRNCFSFNRSVAALTISFPSCARAEVDPSSSKGQRYRPCFD